MKTYALLWIGYTIGGKHPIVEYEMMNEWRARVIAPEEVAERWPILASKYMWKAEGPARMIEEEEYLALASTAGKPLRLEE